MSEAAGSETRVAAAALLRAALRGGAACAGPHLLVGEGCGERAVALADGLIMGRGPEASLRLEDAGVSRRHARLRVGADGAAAIEDLGSKNGLRVNGRAVEGGPTAIGPGDEIWVGTTRLRLVDPSAEHPGAAAPVEGERARPGAGAPVLERRTPASTALTAAALLLLALAAALAELALGGGEALADLRRRSGYLGCSSRARFSAWSRSEPVASGAVEAA